MQTKRRHSYLLSIPLLVLAIPAMADASVWLPSPGTGSVTVSHVSQDADELWAGSSGPNPIPFQGLDQKTTLVSAVYGLSDAVALDGNVGQSKVKPTHGRPIPLGTSGRTDLELGVTWRIRDEIITEGPSIAIRVGGILAGSYDTGGRGPAEADVMGNAALVGAGPTAIGDGGSGLEISGVIGQVIGDQFALSGELGISNRSNDIPRETFINLDAHWIASSQLVFSAQYHIQRSSGDLDLGPPPSPGAHGTNWERFPELAEDVDRISLGGTLILNSFDIGLHWFNVRDGRNTAKFKSTAFTFTYKFGS